MKTNRAYKLSLSIFLVLLHSCGGSRPTKAEEPTPRQGFELGTRVSGDGDSRVSISSDGTGVVFIGTRKDQPFKVFKLVAGKAKALMETGVVVNGTRLNETHAWISPDSKSVFFTVVDAANTPAKTSLYSVDFDSGVTISERIVETSGSIPSLVFSTDSKFFAFTTVAGNSGIFASVDVGAVAAPTLLKAANTLQDQEERVAFFLDTNNLITYSVDSEPKFQKVTVTDINNISRSSWGTVSLTEDVTGNKSYLELNKTLAFSLGKDAVYFTQNVSARKLFVALNGDVDELAKEIDKVSFNLRQDVNTRIVASDKNGGNWAETEWKDWGSKILSLSMSQKNSLGVYVSTERHICKGTQEANPNGTAAQILSLIDLSNKKNTWMLPIYDESSKSWSLATEGIEDGKAPCNIKSGKADYTIVSAVMNSDASLDAYKVVYTSVFLEKVQLFILELKDGKTTVTPVQ